MISLCVIGMYKINRSYYKSNNGRTIKLQQVTLLQHYALSGIQKSYLIADDRNKTTEYSILVRSVQLFMWVQRCVLLRKNVDLY